MIPSYLKRYLIDAVEGAPSVITALTRDIPENSPLWDRKLGDDRFSIREVLAHLADWEPTCRGRIQKTRLEDKPFLPNWDEDQMAIIGDYEHSNPHESLVWFAERRAETIANLKTLTDDEWHRVGVRENVGELSILTQLTLILAHDGYHERQIVETLQIAE